MSFVFTFFNFPLLNFPPTEELGVSITMLQTKLNPIAIGLRRVKV